MSTSLQVDTKHFLYMSIIDILKTRSNCLGSKFGCVIVNPLTNGSMYIGFNGGTISNNENDEIKNCGCLRCIKRSKGEIKSGERLDECVCVHAEPRALMWVPTDYKNTKLMNLYVQGLPCLACTKDIIDTGYVGNIYVYDDYYLDKTKTEKVKELFKENNIGIHYVNYSQVQNYKWQISQLPS